MLLGQAEITVYRSRSLDLQHAVREASMLIQGAKRYARTICPPSSLFVRQRAYRHANHEQAEASRAEHEHNKWGVAAARIIQDAATLPNYWERGNNTLFNYSTRYLPRIFCWHWLHATSFKSCDFCLTIQVRFHTLMRSHKWPHLVQWGTDWATPALRSG